MSLYQLPTLDYLRLRFHLTALQYCELPSWKGSLLRGAFGYALKKTVCTMKIGQPCDSCLLRSKCAYTRIFETFITEQPPPLLRGLDTSPRPYIFEPHDRNQKYQPNDLLWFDLVLVGSVIDFLPYVIYAILQLAHSGLGVQRHRFELATVYCFQPSDQPPNQSADNAEPHPPNWRLLYDSAGQCILFTPAPVTLQPNGTATAAPDSLTLKFLTQTRLKFGNDL
ncbi:MAG: hypothetical protein ONB32_03875, partial [candidate division KSB1 bacterium]|nr:hypothetical protein [candidate division KSB1 bacterium]